MIKSPFILLAIENMQQHNIIHWFRQDLRLCDNPGLSAAAKQGPILPIYIFDEINCSKPLGSASRCWLHHSLQSLNQNLNNKLLILSGNPISIIIHLVKKYSITHIHWNRCYEPWQIKRDTELKEKLRSLGVKVVTHNGLLLWEPWEIEKKDGGNYKVFTPFYRKGCLQYHPPRTPHPKPRKIEFLNHKEQSISLDLLPNINWDQQLLSHWQIGEEAAKKQLKKFIRQGLSDYKIGRDFPAKAATSRLSPHLHFGEISPNIVWHEIKKQTQDQNTDCFLSELGWREFSYSLLYYFPSLPHDNLQTKFNKFPWRKNKKLLQAWQQGQTGYPIIDAGMRELWQTGTMHNRIRMITASFLVKNLLIHWHEGEKWFWDCLLDADLANNSAGWQWVAGSGADAAPFFRIFNPITQGKKFDPEGIYTRHYVPEVANLPDKYLFNPWEAPEAVLHDANIKLGKTYPKPIIDLKLSRQRALESYKSC